MNISKTIIAASCVAMFTTIAFIGFSQQAVAASGAESLAVRKSVMRSIGTHFGAIIGAIKSGNQAQIKKAAGHAKAIQWLAAGIPTLTPAGSGAKAGKSGSLPKIWEDWAGYTKAAGVLNTEAGKLAAVLKSGNAGAALAQFKNTGKMGCGGCHRVYRVKKKK